MKNLGVDINNRKVYFIDMQRTIKFRVWDNKKQSWHNDNNGYVGDTESIGLNELIELILTPNVGVHKDSKRFVIQQFTGIKDCDGKEIFEGDILLGCFNDCETHALPKEEWVETKDYVKWNNNDCWFSVIGGVEGCLTKERVRAFNWKVIGNTFENPNLIK